MVMGDLHDWLAEGAPGGDLREYHRPTVHRLELVEGNELFSPIELETLLGRKGDGGVGAVPGVGARVWAALAPVGSTGSGSSGV
jgi:hypothetical protein